MKDGKTKADEYKLKPYHLKVLWIYAFRAGIINSQQTITKGRIGKIAKKLGLKGKELLKIDRKKDLSSQKKETIELLFEKIEHKPTSLFEKQLEICKELALDSKVFKMPRSFSFNDAVAYAKKSKQLSELNNWVHGAGRNTLASQSTAIWEVSNDK